MKWCEFRKVCDMVGPGCVDGHPMHCPIFQARTEAVSLPCPIMERLGYKSNKCHVPNYRYVMQSAGVSCEKDGSCRICENVGKEIPVHEMDIPVSRPPISEDTFGRMVRETRIRLAVREMGA